MTEAAFRRMVQQFADRHVPFLAYAHNNGYAMLRLTPYDVIDDHGVVRTHKVRKGTITQMRKEIERMRKKMPTALTFISAECDGHLLTIQKGDDIERVDC